MLKRTREQTHPNSDQVFEQLRDQVWVRCEGGFPGVVLVASGRRGEGRTAVVAGLARALADAMTEGTVLAVDADLRAPRLHEVFGADISPGLSDVLTGRSQLDASIQAPHGGKLLLMAAGDRSGNACMLVASEAMRELLARLRDRGGVVLLDSPPLESGPEVQALAGMADKVLLVVRADHTDQREAQNARESLGGPDSQRVLGVVLNDVRLD